MAQSSKHPQVITTEYDSTEVAWANLGNLTGGGDVDASCTGIASKSGTKSKPGKIRARDCGFSIKRNARINWVKAEWEEHAKNPSGTCTGLIVIPSKSCLLLYANGGSNSGGKTDGSSIPCSRTYRSLTWNLSEIPSCKPDHINSGYFGMYLNPARNSSYNTGNVYLDFVRLTVDYTDPTYALNVNMVSSEVLGEQFTYAVTLTNTNGVHQGINIPVSITLPAGVSYVAQSGNGTFNPVTGKWDAALSGSSATLYLTLTSTTTGTKTVTAGVDGFSVTINRNITILNATYTLTSNMEDTVPEGDDIDYYLTVTTNSDAVESVEVSIPLPDGVSYKSSTGDGTFNSGTGVWTAEFTDKNASIMITYTAVTSGSSSVTATVSGGPTDTTEFIIMDTDVSTPFYSDYDLPEEVLSYLSEGEEYILSWYCEVADSSLSEVYPGERNFKIGVVQGTSPGNMFTEQQSRGGDLYGNTSGFGSQSASGGEVLSYESDAGEVGGAIKLTNGNESAQNMAIKIPSTPGISVEAGEDFAVALRSKGSARTAVLSVVWYNASNEYISYVSSAGDVLSGEDWSTLTVTGLAPAGAVTAVIDCALQGAENGEYILIDTCQMNPGTSADEWVVGGTEPGAVITLSTRPVELDTITRCSVAFQYEGGSVTLRLYGQYVEISPATSTTYFSGFMLSHAGEVVYMEPGSLFDNPSMLIVDSDYTTITVPGLGEGSVYLFSDFNWSGWDDDTGLIVTGFEVVGDIILDGEIGLEVVMTINGESHGQSMFLPDSTTTFSVGGEFDRWNFNTPVLSEDLDFTMKFQNITVSDQVVQVKNVRLIVHFKHDMTRGNYGFTLDGGHCRDYNMFLTPGFDKPEGLKLKLELLEFEGNDGDIPSGSRVESKSIKVPFSIVADNLMEGQELLTLAVSWMTNTRNNLKIPVPKTLVFDWDPDREYNVILNDVVDVDFKDGLLECSVEFLLPDGVALSPVKETGASDTNNGLLHVKPVIQVLTDNSASIVITEELSGAELTINEQLDGVTLIIDCQERRVYDADTLEDYTSSVSLTSIWPVLIGDYNFSESTGCFIQKVMFQEAY